MSGLGTLTFGDLVDLWMKGRFVKWYPPNAADHIALVRHLSDCELWGTQLRSATVHVIGEAFLELPRSTGYESQAARVLRRLVILMWYLLRPPGPPGPPFLRPMEEELFLRCSVIPVDYRLRNGLMFREGLSLGEARQLRWTDIDLIKGTITVFGKKGPRHWGLYADVLGALRIWRNMLAVGRGTGTSSGRSSTLNAETLLFPGVDGQSGVFRGHLRRAGVARPELVSDDASIQLADVRGSFVIIAFSTDRPMADICRRTGWGILRKFCGVILPGMRAFVVHGLRLPAPLDKAIPELLRAGGEF